MVPPDRLGRYEIRCVLGSGAMGTVYSAWDPELDRGVAIKIIKTSELHDDDLRRFRREAQALARLSHRNIVAVHDIGSENDAPFIVMELVQGETLAAEIATGRQRPLTQKIELIAQVCDALALAHAHGIIHRDVKPGNILVTTDGVAKLADFGLARLQSSSLTGTADVVGTPAYLAPEAFSGENLDARADVYGIAASLFEWVSGARPHQADHLATLMARVLSDDAPDVRTKWPDCPQQLAECLGRGLARDRSRRFQSAADFASALRALTEPDSREDHAAETVVLQQRNTDSARRGSRRRQFVIAAMLLIVGGTIAVTQIMSPPTGNVEALSIVPPAATVKPEPSPTKSDTPVPSLKRPLESGAPKKAGETMASQPLPAAAVPPSGHDEDDDDVDPPPPALPIGTKVLVAIQTVLRTDSTPRGAPFEGVLVEALTWNGREVAAASSVVQGLVDLVIPGGGGRSPAMQLSLTSIDVGGAATRVRTARYEVVAPVAEGGSPVSTLIIGAIGGAVIGGVVGGSQGAVTGAALGAGALGRPIGRGEFVLGDRLTFKLAEPLRLQPGTY